MTFSLSKFCPWGSVIMAHPEEPTLPEDTGQRKNKNMEELMKMIVRRTALAVCTLVLALILPAAASAACTGFDDVPESADCYKSEIYILRSMRLRKARGTDASPRMRRLRPVNGLSCSAAPTTSM